MSAPVPRRKLTWNGLARRLWSRDVLRIYEAPVDTASPSLRGADCILANRDNLRDLLWFQDPKYLPIFSRFLDEGQVGYFVYVHGRCVHRSWLINGPALINEHWSGTVPIGRQEAFVHYCETAPTARGLGVFPYALSRIAADHPGLRITMSIDQANTASQRAAVKAGWIHTETVTYSLVATRRFSRRSSA